MIGSRTRGVDPELDHQIRNQFAKKQGVKCVPIVSRIVGPFLAISLVAMIAAGLEDVHAQDPQTKGKEEPKLGWSNTSDLSLVVTGGNSDSQTLGFSDKLRYQWKAARVEFKVNVVRANTSDDRFFLVPPGLQFPVGERRPTRGRR